MDKEKIALYADGFAKNMDTPYTGEEIAQVFNTFFRKFRQYTGREHPEMSKEQMKSIAIKMPVYSPYTQNEEIRAGRACEILPEQYSRIMDNYFNSRYRECNYHMHHFMAGAIRRNAAERARIVQPGESPVHIRKA